MKIVFVGAEAPMREIIFPPREPLPDLADQAKLTVFTVIYGGKSVKPAGS
jgi:hypothetical protein